MPFSSSLTRYLRNALRWLKCPLGLTDKRARQGAAPPPQEPAAQRFFSNPRWLPCEISVWLWLGFLRFEYLHSFISGEKPLKHHLARRHKDTPHMEILGPVPSRREGKYPQHLQTVRSWTQLMCQWKCAGGGDVWCPLALRCCQALPPFTQAPFCPRRLLLSNADCHPPPILFYFLVILQGCTRILYIFLQSTF